jgi:methylmalonyl-CoA/ethylmalonyl-CoA epimerase
LNSQFDMAGVLRRAIVPAARRAFAQIARPTAVRATQAMDAHVGTGSGGRCGGWAVRNPPQDIPFAVKGLQHIGLAVPDLAAAAEHYRSVFGAQVSDPVDHASLKHTHVVYVQMPNVCLELLHPAAQESPVAEFLKKNPHGGVHHVSITVDNINSAQGYLNEAGVGSLPIGNISMEGVGQKSGMFLQPKDNMGVLIQLQQSSRPQRRI